MSKYTDIYQLFSDTRLRGKLKPITCKSCVDNDFPRVGECSTCLGNQAYNRDYIETHTFVIDDVYRGYHTGDGHHELFKGLPLRLENEHPYLYYGIEIECGFDEDVVRIYNRDDEYYDEDEDDEDDNWRIQEILTEFSEITEGMFIYEYDGSLDNGVELISRPTSYAYWTHPDTIKRLEKGFEFLKSKGALVKQPDSNGLHIHLSRKFFDFGNTKLDNRYEAYQGFDWIFQKFQPEMEALGGREYTHYCEGKASKLRKSLLDDNYNVRQYPVELRIECKLKKGGNLPEGDHYSAVNLTRQTIEARVFKSSIDYKEILSRIEVVRNIAHAVREEDIEKTLNDILHTKDNLYLDEYISKVKMSCRKNKQEFNLDKMNDNVIDIVAEKK